MGVMSIKLRFLCLLLSAAPCLTHAAFYVEPRVSWLNFSGTPNIGDLGWVAQADEPDIAPTLALGYEISPRIRLELRYTSVGKFDYHKFAPSSAIFPGDQISLPYVRPYEYHQRTQLYTLALPIRLMESKRFAVALTPLAIADDTEVEIADYVYLGLPVTIQTADVGSYLWPAPFAPGNNRRVLRREDGTHLRAGAELTLRYTCTEKLAVTAHCNWANLRTTDLLSYGAGLEFRF